MTDMEVPPFLIWVDIETAGLNPYVDAIFEIGFTITDVDLNIKDMASWYFGHYVTERKHLGGIELVRTMHEKSGLAQLLYKNNDDVADEASIKDMTEWLLDSARKFIEVPETVPQGILGPMCGSSVHFDREFLKQDAWDIVELFNYRNIDVSSVKELCARWNPEVLARRDEVTQPKKLHRAIPDLEDTINEMKFYRDEFLLTTR